MKLDFLLFKKSEFFKRCCNANDFEGLGRTYFPGVR